MNEQLVPPVIEIEHGRDGPSQYFEIPEVGIAELTQLPNDHKRIILTDLHIEPTYRESGIDNALFNAMITSLQEQQFTTLDGVVSDEYTASLFRYFDSSKLLFGRRDKDDFFQDLDLDLEGTIRYLRLMRIFYARSGDIALRDMLPIGGEIYVSAQLN